MSAHRQLCPTARMGGLTDDCSCQEGGVGRKLKSTTVYLRPDQLEWLNGASEISKVPAAEYIRDAIDMFIRSRPELALAPPWRRRGGL